MKDIDFLLGEYLLDDAVFVDNSNNYIRGGYEVFSYLEKMRDDLKADKSEIFLGLGRVTSSGNRIVNTGDYIVALCEFDLFNLKGIFKIDTIDSKIKTINYLTDPSIVFDILEHDGDWAMDRFPLDAYEAMEIRAKRAGLKITDENKYTFNMYYSAIRERIDEVCEYLRQKYMDSEVEEDQVLISDYIYASSFSYVVERELGGVMISFNTEDIAKSYREYTFSEYIGIMDAAIDLAHSIYLGYLEYSKTIGYRNGPVDIRRVMEMMMRYGILHAMMEVSEEFSETEEIEIEEAM